MKPPRVVSMGSSVYGVHIAGDPAEPERETFRIAFPWGDVEIVRARDEAEPDYWVHVRVNRPSDAAGVEGFQSGAVKDARLDIDGRATAEVDLGEFADPGLVHLAVRVGKAP